MYIDGDGFSVAKLEPTIKSMTTEGVRRSDFYEYVFSSVAMRLGPVPAGPVHSCVGAAERFAAVCCVRVGGDVPRDKFIIFLSG